MAYKSIRANPNIEPTQNYDPRFGIALSSSLNSVNPSLGAGFEALRNVGQGLQNVSDVANNIAIQQINQDTADKQKRIQLNDYNIEDAKNKIAQDYQAKIDDATKRADGVALKQLSDEIKNPDLITQHIKNSNFDGQNGESGYLNNKEVKDNVDNFHYGLKQQINKSVDSYIGNKYLDDYSQKVNGLLATEHNRTYEGNQQAKSSLKQQFDLDQKNGLNPTGLEGLKKMHQMMIGLDNQFLINEANRDPEGTLKKLQDGMIHFKGDDLKPAGIYNKYWIDANNIPNVIEHLKNVKNGKAKVVQPQESSPISSVVKKRTGQELTDEKSKELDNQHNKALVFPVESVKIKAINRDSNFDKRTQLEQENTILALQKEDGIPQTLVSNDGLLAIQNIQESSNLSGKERTELLQQEFNKITPENRHLVTNIYRKQDKLIGIEIPKNTITPYTNNLSKNPLNWASAEFLTEQDTKNTERLQNVISNMQSLNIELDKDGNFNKDKLTEEQKDRYDKYKKYTKWYGGTGKDDNQNQYFKKYDLEKQQMLEKSNKIFHIMTGYDLPPIYPNDVFVMNDKIEGMFPKEVSDEIQQKVTKDILPHIQHFTPNLSNKEGNTVYNDYIKTANLSKNAKLVPSNEPNTWDFVIPADAKNDTLNIPQELKTKNGDIIVGMSIKLETDINGNTIVKYPEVINQYQYNISRYNIPTNLDVPSNYPSQYQ